MIEESLYQRYFNALLAGRRPECHETVQNLVDANIDIKALYGDLFQRSMYQVGELWENNRITVANEHLATSITESLLNLSYPLVFAVPRKSRKALISCSPNEYHQVGGKMVADIFELNGWDGHFIGANAPAEDMVQYIQEIKPDVVGLSLAILSNIDQLKHGIEVIRADFPNMDLLIGGQAFRWGGIDMIKSYPGADYVSSLDALEKMIRL
ncbi:MAG: cobalamin-binding protein [Desulfobacteraceae bacterium]|nr:MAG: cobalamin-binding protein [Desulfobacteraceae bacterium]